jgi:hypothetical protein
VSLPRLSLLFALAGAALVLVAVLVGPAGFVRVEGAYFMRAAGQPALSGVFTGWGSGLELLSPSDGNLWLGAGIACLLVALGMLLSHRAGLRLVHERAAGATPS